MAKADSFPACEAARRAIHEGLGGAGLPEEAARHLGTCPACVREAEIIARLVRGLRALPLEEPPPTFWDTLAGRVWERTHAAPRRRPWALSALATAALVLLMIAPADRDQWSLRSGWQWLAEATGLDWADWLVEGSSADEAVQVAQRLDAAMGFDEGTIRQMAQVAEEELGSPDVHAWNVLETLDPQEGEQLLAGLRREG